MYKRQKEDGNGAEGTMTREMLLTDPDQAADPVAFLGTPNRAGRVTVDKRSPVRACQGAGAPGTLARGGGSSFLSNVAVLRTRPSGASSYRCAPRA